MPHFTIEASRELLNDELVDALLSALHEAAVATGIVQADDLKFRVIPIDFALVGGRRQPFVHLTAALLSGRSDQQKLSLSESLLKVICGYFPSVERCSTEIRDMHESSYKKRPYKSPT